MMDLDLSSFRSFFNLSPPKKTQYVYSKSLLKKFHFLSTGKKKKMSDNFTCGYEPVLQVQNSINSTKFPVFESLQFQTEQNFEGSVVTSSSSNNLKSNRRNGPCIKDHKLPGPGIEVKNKGVRKRAKRETIGGRIIALKELLSPFGKADAATVLSETIDYIKHLHGQAQILYSSYLPEDGVREELGSKVELKRRGICLVPVACAIDVTTSPRSISWLPDMENNNGTGP